MSDPLNVLLVGAGRVAERHRDAVAGRGDRVVAVADPDEARAAGLANGGGAGIHASLEAWIESGGTADAAIVTSPSFEHLAQATALVERGIPVLVEKPHRLPGERVDELLAAIERSGAPVQVGMTTRFGAGMTALRDLIAGERLGRPVWVSDRIWFDAASDPIVPWYLDRRRSGGGVLVTNGVHALDRVAWLLGEPLELLSADLRTLVPGREVEDAAVLQLTTPSGVRVDISLLWAPFAVPPSELRVIASDGTAGVRADGSWDVADADGEHAGEAEPELAPFARQWDAFAAVVAREQPPEPSIETVERALVAIEAAYELAGTHA